MIMTIAKFFNLAIQHHRAGRLQDAEAVYRQILQVHPNHPDALHFLGVLAYQLGKHERAVKYMLRAIKLNPANPEYHHNLGAVYRAQGRLDEAAVEYRQVLSLEPAYVESYYNLGNVLTEQGRLDEAAACFREAVARKPDYAEAHNNLANVLKGQWRLEEAVTHYRRAIGLKPANAVTYKNLGAVLKDLSRPDEAAAAYRQALALKPNDSGRVLLATILPVIPGSQDHLLDARRNFERQVDELLDQSLTIADPAGEVAATNFYLAYHGLNDRALQVKVAQLYERACPSLLYTAAHCMGGSHARKRGKIKIGFLSKFLKNHSIGKATRGVLANLSREKFSVCAFFVPPVANDEIANFIQQNADKSVVLPNSLPTARECVAAEKLDILFYQDIGMDPFTYFLAFSRLAPVQCVSFGHPDTTGIRNIDWFISTERFEPENGEEHYSEQLIRLKSPIAYYYKPEVPTLLKSRRQLGFDDTEHLYFCPQTLFKFHPDFDEILAGILRSDPQGRLVLKQDNVAHWAELLLQRFTRTMGDVVDRVTVLPRQEGGDFINLIAVSDVMLDTVHFSGYTTSMEAFAVGTPVVTMPGAFQRGRHTQSFYNEMGFLDCVADSPARYIELAVRLGTDPVYRDEIKAKILAGNHRLYEDNRVVKEYERVFLQLVSDRGNDA